MIHRALLGSMERFIAVLIEHFAGAFPLWLAPVQARVLTVSEKAEAYAHEVTARLQAEGLRVEADVSAEKLGAKIPQGSDGEDPLHGRRGGEGHGRARGFAAHAGRPAATGAPLDEFARRLAQEAAMPMVGMAA